MGATWNAARRTRMAGQVAQILASMSGRRQRCMFCGDSRSTDIEHFWPKARYRGRVFVWRNLLWICAGCNRQKGIQFSRDSHGRPLLIDPTAEDPWDFLFFDGRTGNITARYDPATALPLAKGTHTVDPAVLPLNIEAVAEGRLTMRRNLARAIKAFLFQVTNSTTDPVTLEAELLEAVRDNDEYGLGVWYFRRDGATEPPFQSLQASHPAVWARIAQAL